MKLRTLHALQSNQKSTDLLLVDGDDEAVEVVEVSADLAGSKLLGPGGLAPLGGDVLLLPDLIR